MRALLCVVLLLLIGAAAFADERPWPTRGWAHSTPQAEGLDASALAALDAELASRHGYVDGMLVIRHGRVVFEKSYPRDYDAAFAGAPDHTRGEYSYYDPDWHPYYRRGKLHTMQSVSKSVTSALIGIAIARGEIPGVDTPALPYFDGYRVDDDARRRRLTLRDLLTMRAGIRWDEDSVPYTDPANSCARMEASRDWVQFVLDQPMAAEPGQAFVYSSGVTELLAQVLKKATGAHADEYARRHLFGPLGITNFYWKRTPTGHPDTEGGLYLTARDLAKLGYLYARGGLWEGKRLVPESWVRESTSAIIEVPKSPLRYAYQWWVLPEPANAPAYAALGYGGQRLIVVPELDLIAVFTGWNIYEEPALDPMFALRRVLAAVREPR